MSNQETNGAGGPGQDQPERTPERTRVPVDAQSQPTDEPETAATSSATARMPVFADDPSQVSRARARTVGAGGAETSEAGDALDAGPGTTRSNEPGRSTIDSDRVEITRGGAIDVEARSVHIERGGIGAARADTVDVLQGGIGRLVATNVNVTQGGIGVARADQISVDMGGVGAAMAGRLELSRGAARSVLAREVHLEQAFAQTVVANQVTMARGSGALVVIGRRIEGEVRTLLDWRGALALGAALGLVLGLVRRGSGSRRA